MSDVTSLVLTSAVVSAVVSSTLSIWQDRKKRTFEVRFAEYKRYLAVMEEISSSSRHALERFEKEMSGILAGIVSGDPRVLSLWDSLSGFVESMISSYAKAKGELLGLQLVASAKLRQKLDKFIEIQESLLHETTEMLERAKELGQKPILSDNGRDLGKQSEVLFREVIELMRHDLGIRNG